MTDLFAAALQQDLTKADMARALDMRRETKPLVHVCAVCGTAAHFGFSVKLRQGYIGRWACLEHRDAVRSGQKSTTGAGGAS